MPSIAEKIAARRAAGTTQHAVPAKRLTSAELREEAALEAAIDRIDPPGKRERAETARKTTRLILNANPPPAKPEILTSETRERRSLGAEDGETLDLTPQNATQAEAAWHAAFNAFESDLCLMTDPHNPERAWLAVRLSGQEDWPILLKQLPLYEHPRTVRPTNQPY